MPRLRRLGRPAGTATAHRARRWRAAPARWTTVLGAVVLLVAAIAASTGREGTGLGPATQVTSENSPAEAAVHTPSVDSLDDPAATRERAVAGVPADGHFGGEMFASPDPLSTVEDLLEQGLHAAGASPVHLAIRGTVGAATVRCAWRGIARTAEQREDTIRFWLQLGAADVIPARSHLEALFAATLDVVFTDYRETAKSNFLAIARGGLSEEYRFLTCFADYTVSDYLLGAGPTTVTVAYDNRDEARSYELYRREHEAGTFGSDPLQTRGDYEASLQDIVVAAEEALVAEVGGKERIVFLAPMGAHHAIAFEAWQAVAHWDVETVDGTVNAVRVGAPEGDPEHTQTLADLSTRITTAAANDAHAGSRIANVSGLQGYYQTIGAYGDITPGDGETTTFTPAQPPAAPTCTNGTAVTTPNDNRGLVSDCETLLAAKDGLRGTATLDWATSTAIGSWKGINHQRHAEPGDIRVPRLASISHNQSPSADSVPNEAGSHGNGFPERGASSAAYVRPDRPVQARRLPGAAGGARSRALPPDSRADVGVDCGASPQHEAGRSPPPGCRSPMRRRRASSGPRAAAIRTSAVAGTVSTCVTGPKSCCSTWRPARCGTSPSSCWARARSCGPAALTRPTPPSARLS